MKKKSLLLLVLIFLCTYTGLAKPSPGQGTQTLPGGQAYETGPQAIVLYVSHRATVQSAVLFIESLRSFGGQMSRLPVVVMVDQAADLDLTTLSMPRVECHPIDIDPAWRAFPYSRKVHACATAERVLSERFGTLFYLDTEMLVFDAFPDLNLQENRDIALRPVMLLNAVGQSPRDPVDTFWQAVYQDVGVDHTRIPTLRSYVDEQEMRFYINCEAMAVHPKMGLWQSWQQAFVKRLQDTPFMEKACADDPHRIFLHQAVLSALVAARIPMNRIQWLADDTVYSILLHDRLPPLKKRADLTGARLVSYDIQLAGSPEIVTRVPMPRDRRDWIVDHVCSHLCLAPGVYREEGSCNTGLVKTKTGYILIDPSDTGSSSSWLSLRFASHPPKAILLTHAHLDHWDGLKYWPLDDAVPVIIQRDWPVIVDYLQRFEPFFSHRSQAFTGQSTRPRTEKSPLRPTLTFIDEWRGTIDGVDILMRHTPAETPDTSLVCFPQKGLVFTGDTVYSSFPMLGTPRGSLPRMATDYISALNALLAIHPQTVVPGHGQPFSGSEQIQKEITRYRDAIHYVDEAVVEGINTGKDLYTLLSDISLPAEMALPEAYGKVSWAVRALFLNYTGWFNGKIEAMLDTPVNDLFSELADLVGPEKICHLARTALSAGDVPKTLHLSTVLLAREPQNQEMLQIRKEALVLWHKASRNWGESNLIRQEIRRMTHLLSD